MYMQAYERDMFFPKYTLLILGRYGRNWWRRDSPPNLSCTADEREKVLLSMLAVSESPFLGVNDVKRTTTPGIVRNCSSDTPCTITYGY